MMMARASYIYVASLRLTYYLRVIHQMIYELAIEQLLSMSIDHAPCALRLMADDVDVIPVTRTL
jgi:hypothetical protein